MSLQKSEEEIFLVSFSCRTQGEEEKNKEGHRKERAVVSLDSTDATEEYYLHSTDENYGVPETPGSPV